jgi:WhiB family redox-sensing transcriptional regulator
MSTTVARQDADVDPVLPGAWMADGSCRGHTDLFFAPHAERPQARLRREAKARLLCQGCPSLDPCRTWAREQREYGFWGGESEEERFRAGYSVTVAPPLARVRTLVDV